MCVLKVKDSLRMYVAIENGIHTMYAARSGKFLRETHLLNVCVCVYVLGYPRGSGSRRKRGKGMQILEDGKF